MKRSVVTALIVAASGSLWALRRKSGPRNRQAERRHAPVESNRPAGDSDQALRYVTVFVLPVWTIAGVADYLWHRRTKIETTSGVEESFTHLLMMVEMAPSVLAGLFLETNATTLAIMIASFLVHQATAVWDVAYTAKRRLIPTGEQHTHSFLEMVPFCIASFAICTHWDEFLSLLGKGTERPKFRLTLRRPPLPPWRTAGIVGLLGASVVVPHVEELLRCWKAGRSGQTGRDTPECARKLYSGDRQPELVS